MMAAGSGSSPMSSELELGNMQQYEQLFSRVKIIEERKKPITTAGATNNPEESKEQQKTMAKPAMAKQTSVTTQEDEFEVVTQVKQAPAAVNPQKAT